MALSTFSETVTRIVLKKNWTIRNPSVAQIIGTIPTKNVSTDLETTSISIACQVSKLHFDRLALTIHIPEKASLIRTHCIMFRNTRYMREKYKLHFLEQMKNISFSAMFFPYLPTGTVRNC